MDIKQSYIQSKEQKKQQQHGKYKQTINSKKSLCSYLLPVLHHLTCKSSLYCKSSFGTINCHSKLNVNTLRNTLEISLVQIKFKIKNKNRARWGEQKKKFQVHLDQVLRADTSFNKNT